MEEVDLATFIQSIMVAPSLEPKVVVPSGFVPEVVLTVDAVSTPRTAATDKGKGVFARPPKNTQSTRPKRIMIGTPAATVPSAKEAEDGPILGEIDLTLPAADIPRRF